MKKHLSSYSDRIGYSPCNLGDTSEVRSAVSKAAEFLEGRIDFVVANAGIAHPYWKDSATIMDPATLDQWKAYVDVNLTGNFALAQAALPYMLVEAEPDKQKRPDSSVGGAGPCIVFVSSFRGIVSDPNQEGYAATKAGLIGLTTSLAVSAQAWGVRVNAVSPGRIKVQHENPRAEENGEEWKVEGDDVESHLSNRAGMPTGITEAVEYLLGAGFVSGQNLVVDGGVTAIK